MENITRFEWLSNREKSFHRQIQSALQQKRRGNVYSITTTTTRLNDNAVGVGVWRRQRASASAEGVGESASKSHLLLRPAFLRK